MVIIMGELFGLGILLGKIAGKISFCME